MPELPEVHTTVEGLRRVLVGKKITDVWSSYPLPIHEHKQHIKSKTHFEKLKNIVTGKKVLSVDRRGKNILIHLSGKHSILVHMKMSGHFLYGAYKQEHGHWKPAVKTGPLLDPYNQYIRLLFTLSNGKQLAFSDLRKFAKVLIAETDAINHEGDLEKLGPEPLEKSFTYKRYTERLALRPHAKIKQLLLDQTIIAGIGNIYSDEMLWEAGIHPLSITEKIPNDKHQLLYKAIGVVLRRAIEFGGDSDTDYRNVDGEPGRYQNLHRAYHQTKKPCRKKGCPGSIERLKIGGRSAHFCPVHQTRY